MVDAKGWHDPKSPEFVHSLGSCPCGVQHPPKTYADYDWLEMNDMKSENCEGCGAYSGGGRCGHCRRGNDALP